MAPGRTGEPKGYSGTASQDRLLVGVPAIHDRGRVSPDQPTSIACYHQAGHAVAARRLGAREIGIDLEGEATDLVRRIACKTGIEAMLTKTQATQRPWRLACNEDWLQYAAGGQAAEYLVSNGASWSVRYVPGGGEQEDEHDLDRALKHLDWIGGTKPPDPVAWWRALVLKATELLRPRWHEVEALAGLLQSADGVMLYAGDSGPRWDAFGESIEAYESEEERAERLAGAEFVVRPGGFMRRLLGLR